MSKFIIHKKQSAATIYGYKMFGKSKRQVKDVTFVQPLKGEAYFYTPIAYSSKLKNSKNGTQVFTDSDLALAGKLKLIFERENMVWFEIKEEQSTTPFKDERLFAMYYYPHRLVVSRASAFAEKATLQDIKKLFDFIVTEEQNRVALVRQLQSPSAYSSLEEQTVEEPETISTAIEEAVEESEPMSILAEEPPQGSEAVSLVQEEPRETSEVVFSAKQRKR